MEATIKETVKNIFKANAFEAALELTRNLRGEYIREYGVKSWNALVSYYRKANIQPEVAVVAEPDTIFPEANMNEPCNEDKENDCESDIVCMKVTPEDVANLHNTLAGIFGEDPVTAESTNANAGNTQVDEPAEESSDEVKTKEEEERVKYMLYQNDGEKIAWYGHFVNYKGLKVGESGMMVRMNNLGVGRGKVLATASMTMEEIGIFHKCYAAIRQSTLSDNKRVELFTKAFNNLQSAMRDSKFATLSAGKAIANFVLNYKKED